jgi:hypothetical protein
VEEINPKKTKEERTLLSSSVRKPLAPSGPVHINSVLEEAYVQFSFLALLVSPVVLIY